MLARKLEEYEEEYESVPVPQQTPTQAPQSQHLTAAQQARAYAQSREGRRAVVRRSNLRSRIATMLLLGGAMLGALIYVDSMVAAKGFEIVQLRTQAVKLEAENAQLKITNAHLKSPQRIKEIATQKLGLTVSDKVYFADSK